MAETLGIMVSSDKHLDYVINLTRAAHEKGKEVQIFFTGKGVLLALMPGFEQLVGKAKLSICDVSFRANGLHGREEEVHSLSRSARRPSGQLEPPREPRSKPLRPLRRP